MLNKPPTPPQQKYIDAIRAFESKNGYSPNYTDLHNVLGVRVNAVVEMLDRLERKKYINVIKIHGAVRKITIINSESGAVDNRLQQKAETAGRTPNGVGNFAAGDISS